MNGQAEALSWETYFEPWEELCGGNSLEVQFQKAAKDLSDGEWQKVMKEFRKMLKEFINETDATKIVFGGGVAIKQSKRILALKSEVKSELSISKLGENAGLYGGFALFLT